MSNPALTYQARTAASTINVRRPIHRGRLRLRSCRAVTCLPRFIDIGDEWIEAPQKRKELWPSFDLSWEQAIEVQMMAVQQNNDPYADHGIEIMYRFANFDPFTRSSYFGRSYDLGQFERFRRLMHTRFYETLLGHTERTVLSTLQVNSHTRKQRFHVKGFAPNDEQTYEITMVQRVGGRYDGYWFAESLICADMDWEELRSTGI